MSVNKVLTRQVITENNPIILQYNYIDHDYELEIMEILSVFLNEIGQSEYKELLSYSLRELCANASKANLKRLYFKIKNLDINNPSVYKTGIGNFRSDMAANPEILYKHPQIHDYQIFIYFHLSEAEFCITVSNNTLPTKIEKQNIENKLAKAKEIQTLADTFKQVIDYTEGAGLGIISTILMLRQIGLEKNELTYFYEEDKTSVEIRIPLLLTKTEKKQYILDAIIQEINTVPQIPEKIIHLQNMIDSPDADLSAISKEIKKDITFSSDLFRLVNSATFSRYDNVNNIFDAVKIIGLKMLKNILYSYSTTNILNKKYKMEMIKKIWDHSLRVAYFSYLLAKNKKIKNFNKLDEIYTCGLLHDIGKIILWGQDKNTQENLYYICKVKKIPIEVLEEINPGQNHATVGFMLAKKWNFPIIFQKVIELHHQPFSADKEILQTVKIVYLANSIDNYLNDKQLFFDLDSRILDEYQIERESQFRDFCLKIKAQYQAASDK